jgi:hypothetical protein
MFEYGIEFGIARSCLSAAENGKYSFGELMCLHLT